MVFSVYRIEKQVLLPLSNGKTLISSNELIGEIQITKVENSASKGKILIEDNKHKIKYMCYVQEYEKPPIPNRPPIIKSINIKPDNPIQPGKVVEVKVDAIDPNSDSLIYSWETDRGYFLSDNTLVPVNYWVAPFEKDDFTITVSVNDQRGGTEQKKKTITVNKPRFDDDLGDYKKLRIFKNDIGSGNNLHVLDVDFDSENNMYVLYPEGHCIRVFDSKWRYPKTLCAGKLISPNELLIEGDKIYVIYNNNKYVKRYDLRGNLEVTYSKKGMDKYDIDILRCPIALAVGNEGELYVIDGIGPNIAVFERDGRFRLRFGDSGTGRGKLVNPVAVCVDRGGYIYVLDSDKQEIIVYSPRMQYDRTIKLKKGKYKDMFLNKIKDQFYLVNASNKNILVIDSSGNTIDKFGRLGNPFKICMDKFSNIYVTNKTGSYINKYIYKENTYKYYGKFGTDAFSDITDIAVDMDSSIFLLNGKRGEIIKVDKDGWELTRFGGKGVGIGEFKKPISIVTSKNDEYIYVLDKALTNKKVLQFSNSGKFLRVVVSQKDGRIRKPIDIDSDMEGNLYVLDAKADVCFVYDHRGKFMNQIGTKGKKKEFDLLYKPVKVAVDRDGENVYIFDDNSKLRKVNKYVKKDFYKYNYLRYDKCPKNTSIIKVNNYKRLMVADTTELSSHKINFFKGNGALERTLKGKNTFMTIKDIEVDGVENVYILDDNSNVYVFKQEKLWK